MVQRMREELAAGGSKWPQEQVDRGAPIAPEDRLADELADELSRAPPQPEQPQQHLFVVEKRKAGSQQQQQHLSSTAKRQRRAADRSNKQQAAEAKPTPPAAATPAPPEATTNEPAENLCAACCKPIHERYLLMALDKRWHEDCLKCACCDCRLAEVGSSLFLHSDKILCRRDFARIFGPAGTCAACKQLIPPHEMVMRAHRHAYHMDCFRCLKCLRAFCVGDPYYLSESQRILCVDCHELLAAAPGDAALLLEPGAQEPAGSRPAQLEERPEVELHHHRHQVSGGAAQHAAECAST